LNGRVTASSDGSQNEFLILNQSTIDVTRRCNDVS